MTKAETDRVAGIVSCVERITREIAELYLRENRGNRRMRNTQVQRLCAALRAGEWQVNGDAIRFSKSGRLLDGQHRLTAVVITGIPITTVVTRGLDDVSFETIDQDSATRSAADTIGGVAGRTAAAIARMAIADDKVQNPFGIKDGSKFTSKMVADYARSDEGLMHAARTASVLRGKIRFMEPSVIGFIYLRAMRQSSGGSDAADEFFDSLATGAGLDASSPILVLRNRLQNNAIVKRGGSTSDHKSNMTLLSNWDIVEMTVRAWNLWRSGDHASPGRLARRKPDQRGGTIPEMV